MFNIGDFVLITHPAHTYPNWPDMFHELGFTYPDMLHQCNASNKEQVCLIFNKGIHPDHGVDLYAVRDVSGNEWLFNERGLSKDLQGNYIPKKFTTYINY